MISSFPSFLYGAAATASAAAAVKIVPFIFDVGVTCLMVEVKV